MREKKVREKRCEWCGAKIVRTACPRGPFCAAEQRNHEELMARINKSKKNVVGESSRDGRAASTGHGGPVAQGSFPGASDSPATTAKDK